MPTPHAIHASYPGRAFGKNYPRFSRKMLHFEDYATPALPAPPPRVDWTRGFDINWRMMLNDSLGCCVEAAKGHAIQTLTLDNGRMRIVPDSVILANYEANGGYVPSDPSTDNGEDMVSSLDDTIKNGFGGFAVNAIAAPRLSLFEHIQQAIWLLGGIDIGFNVPQSAMDQNAAGRVWDVVANDGGIVGGHSVWVPMYDAKLNLLTCVTWGMRQMMTWKFWMKYVDEGYVLRAPAWIGSHGVAPSGFLDAQWVADTRQLTAAS